MTPRQAHAIGALIQAGEAMAVELDLCADELEDDNAEHAAEVEREMIRAWKRALTAFRGEQLDLFAEEAA
jgi:antirestriction protein ArdC